MILSPRLRSVRMTDEEIETLGRRRGYWLRKARDRVHMDQNSVAKAIGLSARSGTSVLSWEKGRRSPKADQLHRLARLYGVPVATFTDPRPTDEEWLDDLAEGKDRDAAG
jgi:transcriptional regulator with XRE-family HTH domain